MRTDTLVALGTAALLVATAPLPASACCAAPPRDQHVAIASQEILVSWDAKTKLEHFVRRAEFQTQTTDPTKPVKPFGFLVPTPTQPALSEAENAAFDRLDDAIKPAVKEEVSYDVIPAAFCLCLKAGCPEEGMVRGPPTAAVHVLDEAHVAGYDAVVLEADDAKALASWLKEHDFESRPELVDWLEPYVAARWKVTAFRFAPKKEEPAGTTPTKAVRMSFTTDRPLFPYRVPKDQRAGSNLLRVFYVGTERAEGALHGPAGTERAPSPWIAETKYANALATLPALVKGALPDSDVPANGWLTAFEDSHWPGSGDDLFFSPATDRSSLVPAPIIHHRHSTIFVPLDLIVIFGVLVRGAIAVRRRLRAQ